LVSIGRRFNTDNLGLETVGVEVHKGGWIRVNDKLETSIKGIYAIGDILGPERFMLAHVASAEARTAVENCMGGDRKMSYNIVPQGVFTSPEIACVGLSEEQVKSQGLHYRIGKFNLRGLGKAQADCELSGMVKIIAGKDEKGRILGVHIIGAHATELISESALAMKTGAGARQLAETIHLHPSLSEGVMETAHDVFDECLHLPLLRNAKRA